MSMSDYITRSTENVFFEIEAGREKAHAKHGENSIEGIGPLDPRWLPILVEEVGEIAQALNDGDLGLFDSDERLRQVRAELVDVATVAAAWISALDSMQKYLPGHFDGDGCQLGDGANHFMPQRPSDRIDDAVRKALSELAPRRDDETKDGET